MLQARHDIDLGLVSQQCFRLAQVGVRSRDITGLVWLPIEYRRTSQRRFQKANEREQRHGVGASQVENLIGAVGRLSALEPSPGTDNALYDIIHVGIVTL